MKWYMINDHTCICVTINCSAGIPRAFIKLTKLANITTGQMHFIPLARNVRQPSYIIDDRPVVIDICKTVRISMSSAYHSRIVIVKSRRTDLSPVIKVLDLHCSVMAVSDIDGNP